MAKYTITEMKERNQAMGQFFFERKSMRFFNSKVHTGTDENGYFITSEQFVPSQGPADPRKFSIRHFDWETGNVNTVGEFQHYRTLEEAKQARKSLGPFSK